MPDPTSPALPFVSVIIPAYNGAQTLGKLLAALSCQTYPRESLEVIVVDNNSQDGSDQIARSFTGVKVVYEPVQGRSAARNRGIATAQGSVLAFTDCDCIPHPDWIRAGVQLLLTSGAQRVGGQIILDPITPDSPSTSLLDALYNFHQAEVIRRYGAVITANFITYRSLFGLVGLFNPQATGLEDMEFGLRAELAHTKAVYAPDSIIFHPPRDWSTLLAKGRASGRGTYLLCKVYPTWSGLWGWKHPLRIIKLLLWPRPLHWQRLPFSPRRLRWSQVFWIHLLGWRLIYWPSALTYAQLWLQDLVNRGLTTTKAN